MKSGTSLSTFVRLNLPFPFGISAVTDLARQIAFPSVHPARQTSEPLGRILLNKSSIAFPFCQRSVLSKGSEDHLPTFRSTLKVSVLSSHSSFLLATLLVLRSSICSSPAVTKQPQCVSGHDFFDVLVGNVLTAQGVNQAIQLRRLVHVFGRVRQAVKIGADRNVVVVLCSRLAVEVLDGFNDVFDSVF